MKCHKTTLDCLFYNHIKCVECNEGYIINQNFFFDSFYIYESLSGKDRIIESMYYLNINRKVTGYF